MLLSQKEEQSRRFKLALRAGIPVLLLVFLVFYTTIDKTENISISLKDGILLAAITFIAIYFIYFLMDLSAKETMIDQTTQGFNKKAFVEKLKSYSHKTVACLNIENLQSLNENYSTDQVDTLLYTITGKLNLIFKQKGLDKVLIGRNRGSEFLIAINEDINNIQTLLELMCKENKNIQGIEVDYKFAIIANTSENFEKSLVQLRDIIASQSIGSKSEKKNITHNALELSGIEHCVIGAIQNKNLLLSFRPLLNTHRSYQYL